MEKLFVGLIPTAPDNFPTGICRQWVGDQVVLQSSETRIIYIHNFHHHHHHHLGMRKNLAVKTVIVFWGTTVLVDSCPALTTTIKSIKRRRYFTDIWKFIRRFIISSLSLHTVITRTGRTGNRHKNKQGVNTPWGGTFSTAIVPVIDPAEWHTGPYCQVYIAACERLDHSQTKVKPALQVLCQSSRIGWRTFCRLSHRVRTHQRWSIDCQQIASRIKFNGPMETVPLEEDSSNGIGSVGLLLVPPPVEEMRMMPNVRHQSMVPPVK
ncbi:hypothetical protein IV203_009470 [Nitzschia inconspicua]|uniref:Uncharacterized protein n=1 Tax=Nitzschia inconspicua TaxID=303405 RepID=A0A9K3PK07_9STRA|nr:hypothetical protein IV203_009470 [Nitzschia inconspicua]